MRQFSPIIDCPRKYYIHKFDFVFQESRWFSYYRKEHMRFSAKLSVGEVCGSQFRGIWQRGQDTTMARIDLRRGAVMLSNRHHRIDSLRSSRRSCNVSNGGNDSPTSFKFIRRVRPCFVVILKDIRNARRERQLGRH
jgi:hypothetical protein